MAEHSTWRLNLGVTTSLLMLSVLLLGSNSAAETPFTFQRLYSTSDPAPGAAAGVVFRDFAYPILSDNGSIAFTALLADSLTSPVDLATGKALFGPGPTGATLIERSNQPATGVADGAVYEGFYSPVLSDSKLFYRTLLRTGSGDPVTSDNDNALYSATPVSPPELIVRENGPSPGLVNGTPLAQYTAPPLLMNSGGEVAFEGFLTQGGVPPVTIVNDNVLFAPTPGGLDIAAREGDTAPGALDAAAYSVFEAPVLNDLGEVAFRATLRTGVGGAPVGFGNDGALFGPTPGGLGLVAREGDPVPGASDGARFGLIGEPALNAAGGVAFYSILLNAPGGTERAVVGPTVGGLGLVARGGDVAPGAGGDVYNDFSPTVLLNEQGQLAFKSQLRTASGAAAPNADALFGPTSTGLALLAREGEPAPGVADDALFGNLTDTMTMNGVGDLVFDAVLRDGPSNSVNAANDRGIFVHSHLTDSLHLLFREGGLFDLGEGDYLGPRMRTIRSWEFITGSGGGDGLPRSLNDRGQLLLELDFTDGSSALIMTQLPSSIPEPTSVALLLVGLCWATTSKHRPACRKA